MPRVTVEQALQELRDLAQRGVGQQLTELQEGLSAVSAKVSPAASLPEIPDISAELLILQKQSLEIKERGETADAGLGQLGQVFNELGLSQHILFGEQKEVPAEPKQEEEPEGRRRFFIDPETGVVIEGKLAGELPRGRGVKIAAILARAERPLTQPQLTRQLYGKNASPGKQHELRSRISQQLNGPAWTQKLPKVVENVRGSGYVLSPNYDLVGIDRTFRPGEEMPPEQEQRPVRPQAYRIAEVAEATGMPVTRVRNLAYELMKTGQMRVGEEVVERHEGEKSYVDYTEEGKELLKTVQAQFAGLKKIPVKSVRRWLDEQNVEEDHVREEPRLYFGSQVAETAGIPTAALNVMHKVGVFEEGVHFVRKGERNIRVYTAEAVLLAARVKARADKEGQHRFTERLVRDEFRIYEPPTENPFGENGPKTVNDKVEFFLLQTVRTCLPAMTRRGIVIDPGQEERLKSRIAQLTEQVEYIEPEQLDAIRTLAAATAFDLTQNQRPFNPLRTEYPGLQIVGHVIGALKAAEPNLLVEFPQAVKDPPKPIPVEGARGEVNGSILVGWMGDRR